MRLICMVKLSQQIQPKIENRVLTRTERVLEKQKQKRELEKLRLLKQEADEVRKKEFSNIKSIEEYEAKYKLLKPELKQFFTSPQILRQQQTKRISENIQKTTARLSYAEERKKRDYESYARKLRWIEEQKSKEIRNDRLRILEEKEEHEQREWEKKEAYWNNYIRGLKEGLGKLRSNKDISFSDIENYADALGTSYKERKASQFKKLKENKLAYEKLLKESAFSNVFRDYNKRYKGKIDWTNKENIDLILERYTASKYPERWIEQKKKGLTKGETKQVKNVSTGKLEEVTYWTDKTGKKQLQLIETKGDNVLQYRQLGGKFSGQVAKFKSAKIESDIFQQRKKIDEEYKKITQPDKIFLDVKEVDTSNFGSVTRGTISDQKKIGFRPIQVEIPKTESKNKPILKKFIDKTKGFGKLYFNPPKLIGYGGLFGGGLNIISPIKTSEKSIDLEKEVVKVQEKIPEKQQELYLKEIERKGLKEEAEKKFSDEYTTRFYRSDVGKKAFYGEMDFEEAEKRFSESQEAKIINKKYHEYIQEKRKGKFTKEGFKIATLETEKRLLGLIPTTLGKAGLTAGSLYVLKKIPTPVTTGLLTTTGTLGVTTALSPEATPEQKAGGIITAGTSVALLGIQGVRKLKQPKLKTITETRLKKSIISPKLERGFVTKKGSLIETDVSGKKTYTDFYKTKKMSEQIIYGRKTIMTTKFRELLNLNPIKRSKAIKILTKKGLSEYKAKEILRYRYPKKILSKYEADVIVKYGDLYKKPVIDIKGERVIEQPVKVIDAKAGIKTRGARTIKEFITGKGTIESYKGKTLYPAEFDITKTYVTKEGRIYQSLKQAGKTRKILKQITSVTDKADEVLELQLENKGISYIKGYPYTVVDEKTLTKQVIPRGKLYYTESEGSIFKKEAPIIGIDYRKIYGYSLKEDILKKQHKLKMNDLTKKENIKKLMISLKDVYGDKIKKLDITPVKPSSKNIAKTTIIQSTKATTKLKTSLYPIQTMKKSFKNVIILKQKIKDLTRLGFISTTITRNIGRVKAKQKSLNVQQRQISSFRVSDLIRQNVQTKTLRSQLNKQNTLLQQAQINKLMPEAITIPAVQIPRIPRPAQIKSNVGMKPFVFGFDFKPPAKTKVKTETKTTQELLYIPDFTSRALGLEPEIISEKEAKKKLKQLLTGLEIRRPVKIQF